jgi:tetratricopeptide (TPR) repeat protein
VKYVPTIITGLLLPLPACLPGEAGTEWDILNQEVEELYRTGRYGRAVVIAKKALEVAEKNVGPNHPEVTLSLNILALLYYAHGQYTVAEPLFKRALAIDEKVLGPHHPAVARDLNNLALLYRATERDTEAAILEQRAARIETIQR